MTMLISPDVTDRTKADSIESLMCCVYCIHVEAALMQGNTAALELATVHSDGSGDLLEYLLSRRFTGIWSAKQMQKCWEMC